MSQIAEAPVVIETITIDKKAYEYLQDILEKRKARQRAYYHRNAEERRTYASA